MPPPIFLSQAAWQWYGSAHASRSTIEADSESKTSSTASLVELRRRTWSNDHHHALSVARLSDLGLTAAGLVPRVHTLHLGPIQDRWSPQLNLFRSSLELHI